jgi:Uma2 family endonuclease
VNGGGCRSLGPDAGVATVDDTVRYPDALITCAKVPGSANVVPGVVIVFEVVSRTSGRIDRIIKLREYRAVSSILRYIIAERNTIGLTVLSRTHGDEDWSATALTADDILKLPEVGIEIPVTELYDNVDLALADQQETC